MCTCFCFCARFLFSHFIPKTIKTFAFARVIYHRIALHYLFIFKHMSPQVLISLFFIFCFCCFSHFQWQRKRLCDKLKQLQLSYCSLFFFYFLRFCFSSVGNGYRVLPGAPSDLRFIVIAAFMIDYWLELYDTHARMRDSHTKMFPIPTSPAFSSELRSALLDFGFPERIYALCSLSFFSVKFILLALLSRISSIRHLNCNWI